ncbi:eukaryotic translation initiation factor 3 subunit G [Trichomonascus vanleenenianus]|uniref:translation initiation factor eIF3 core subunit g n=1 Tax=Trichomonascus vanleenenianus TaxID=2268995 RepID=UPI003ECBACD8
MSAAAVSKSWADEDDVPQVEVIENPDNTKTVITYQINPDTGRKMKITKRIREVKTRERVDHSVAERKKWAKYGLEKGQGPGPNVNTTQVEPDQLFKLVQPEKVKKAEPEPVAAEPSQDANIVCRLCGGVHFTSRCPYKATLGAPEEKGGAPEEAEAAPQTGSAYIAPHKRAGAVPRATLDNETENTTLRVSNLSEDVMEEELRSLFAHFGHVNRCHVVKDRDTGRNRGFAFVTFDMPREAENACKRLNGYGLDNLIMRVEFSKK